MSDSTLIALFLFGAFVLFITAKGELGVYLRLLV